MREGGRGRRKGVREGGRGMRKGGREREGRREGGGSGEESGEGDIEGLSIDKNHSNQLMILRNRLHIMWTWVIE